jgi:hypothetical protein
MSPDHQDRQFPCDKSASSDVPSAHANSIFKLSKFQASADTAPRSRRTLPQFTQRYARGQAHLDGPASTGAHARVGSHRHARFVGTRPKAERCCAAEPDFDPSAGCLAASCGSRWRAINAAPMRLFVTQDENVGGAPDWNSFLSGQPWKIGARSMKSFTDCSMKSFTDCELRHTDPIRQCTSNSVQAPAARPSPLMQP